jgi:hypothetical protein
MDNLNYGNKSSYETSMGINFQDQWIKVCWKSKSGIIYHLHDEVDCNDIEFWLEGIDLPLLYQQLYGPTTLPFKIPPVHYQLVVGSISISLDLMVKLKEAYLNDIQEMETQLNTFIAGFNAKSEKKDRKDGVVHNWRTRIEGLQIIAELDLGSAGAAFFKKLLKWLNGFEQIEKVIVGNTPENQ